jgi:glycosyltransferase involved in cell wall biosynthesis/predicted SAM-dependent methyltransferase
MRITVATTHATYPPHSGAALRNFHLYRHVARRHEIELLALVKRDAGARNSIIAPGLREIRIPISAAHEREELRVCEKAGGRPVSDLAAARLYPYTPEYIAALEASCNGADVLIASHPHLVYALRELSSKPLIYEAPDVECDLQRALLPNTADGRRLLAQVETTEANCVAEADLVFACSNEDRERFIELYGVVASKIQVAPNGVDVEGVPFASWMERERRRCDRGQASPTQRRFCCLFLASWASFNVDAADRVVEMAWKLPETSFVIAGSVGLPFKDRGLPSNVTITGLISEHEKLDVLAKADVALNPVEAGSGSNIKMGEYVAAGLPIITTSFGSRGWSDVPVIVCELDKFVDCIRHLASSAGDQSALEMARSARLAVGKDRAWSTIGDAVATSIEVFTHSQAALSAGRRDKVGVLISVLNAERYIEECLLSVLAQTHQSFEVFVVDDGCQDKSAEIIRAVAARDERVHLLRHPRGENRGLSRSLELALRHSRAEYVALLDADDAFDPEKLALQIAALRAHPEAVLCHSRATVVTEEETELSKSVQTHFDVEPTASVYRLLEEPGALSVCHILKSSTLIRRSAIQNVRFAGRQLYQSDDWLLMVLLASRGPFVFLNERLVKYRVHPASYTSRVLTDPVKDLYGRLEMFLKLLSQTKTSEMKFAVKPHMDGVLWLLERVYAEDAPAQVTSAASPPGDLEPEALKARLDAILQSRSWHITAPLRGASRGATWLRQTFVRHARHPGRLMKTILARSAELFWPGSLLRQAEFETTTFVRFTIARLMLGSKFRGKLNLLVNIGCGPNVADGYVNLDVVSHPKVYFWDCRKSLPFDDDSVEVIFAEHVFEHFEYKVESLRFLTECYRCLKKGGVMRVVVPDAGRYLSLYDSPWECLVPIRPFIQVDDGYRDVWLNTTYKTKMEFINAVFRQGIEHKFAYDFETLDLHLREAGFEMVQLQDYGRSASPHPPLDSALRRTESLYVEGIK